jgi:hypothetical protein
VRGSRFRGVFSGVDAGWALRGIHHRSPEARRSGEGLADTYPTTAVQVTSAVAALIAFPRPEIGGVPGVHRGCSPRGEGRICPSPGHSRVPAGFWVTDAQRVAIPRTGG